MIIMTHHYLLVVFKQYWTVHCFYEQTKLRLLEEDGSSLEKMEIKDNHPVLIEGSLQKWLWKMLLSWYMLYSKNNFSVSLSNWTM